MPGEERNSKSESYPVETPAGQLNLNDQQLLFILYDGWKTPHRITQFVQFTRKTTEYRLNQLQNRGFVRKISNSSGFYEITAAGALAGHYFTRYSPAYDTVFTSVAHRIADAQTVDSYTEINPQYVKLTETELRVLRALTSDYTVFERVYSNNVIEKVNNNLEFEMGIGRIVNALFALSVQEILHYTGSHISYRRGRLYVTVKKYSDEELKRGIPGTSGGVASNRP